MLLAGISAMAWWYAARRSDEEEQPAAGIRSAGPLGGDAVATGDHQILLGRRGADPRADAAGCRDGPLRRRRRRRSTAFPLSEWLPYVVARTWHVQLGLFWIATAWLAAGLFIGPLVSEQEPKGQRLGVNVLFLALLVVVVGSLAGQWLSVHNKLSDAVSFYFGHQGYEYVDLGRAWQIALLVGLLLWLFLMLRVLLARAATARASKSSWWRCSPLPPARLRCSTAPG